MVQQIESAGNVALQGQISMMGRLFGVRDAILPDRPSPCGRPEFILPTALTHVVRADIAAMLGAPATWLQGIEQAAESLLRDLEKLTQLREARQNLPLLRCRRAWRSFLPITYPLP